MHEILEAADLVAELHLQRDVDSYRLFLLVEGPSDSRSLMPLIDSAECAVFVIGNKRRILEAMMRLPFLDPMVVALVDRDFDHWLQVEFPQNTCRTESYDREADVLLKSGLLASYIEQSIDSRKTSAGEIPRTGSDVHGWIVDIASVIGRLRWVSVRDGLELRLRKFPIGAVMSEPFEVDKRLVVETALNNSSPTASTEDSLVGLLDILASGNDGDDYCNGHDLVRATAVTSKHWADKQLGRNEFDNFVQKATRREDYEVLSWFGLLQEWAEIHSRCIWTIAPR